MSTVIRKNGSSDSGSKGSLYTFGRRPSDRQPKNKTHKSRREKRQELISRLKPSNKDSRALDHGILPVSSNTATASSAASAATRTPPTPSNNTDNERQQRNVAVPLQDKTATATVNQRRPVTSTAHIVTPERHIKSRRQPSVVSDEMSDILNNVANDFVAKKLTSPANVKTTTVRKAMTQQTTKRNHVPHYDPNAISESIDDQENDPYNHSTTNHVATNNYFYTDAPALGNSISGESSHSSSFSSSSSSVSFFNDANDFSNANMAGETIAANNGHSNQEDYGHFACTLSDNSSVSGESAHILNDLESTNHSFPMKLNLGARYAHLMNNSSEKTRKKKQQHQLQQSESSNAFKSNSNGGFGSFMNHPFVPLESPSFCSSSPHSELSVEENMGSRQIYEERQNVAMNTSWEPEPDIGDWVPFHNADAKPSDAKPSAKRVLSPDQPPKRMIKSPRSEGASVLRGIPSVSSGDSSMNSDQERHSQQFSDKIANAFRSVRPVHGGDKKIQQHQQVPVIRPTQSHQARNANHKTDKEHRPKVSFAPTVQMNRVHDMVQTYSDMAPPAHESSHVQHLEPQFPQAVHVHHHDGEDGSMSSTLYAEPSAIASENEAEEPPVATAFDIKVAVLGGRQAGKSTVLNAFFQEQFADSSRSGVNYYALSRERTDEKQHIVHLPDKDSTLTVGKTGKEVSEHHFDVELSSDILKDMRDDARLVFVDVPAFFPEGSHYLDYLERQWDEMDCAIVVLDVMSTNSVENITIMNFVKHCLKKRKDLPIVIVCNKVDDTEDDELMAMVDAIRQESLAAVIGEKSTEKVTNLAFIPISAKNAFWYRSASMLSFEEFKKLDKSKIDEMGREEIGRFRWKKLSSEEQYMAVYGIIQDEEEYKIRVRASNFDILMNSLDHFIGGKKKQDRMIRKQLEASLKKLSHDAGYYDRLVSIYRQSLVVGRPTSHLKPTFWALYDKSRNEAFAMFQKSPSHVTAMKLPMQVLIRYASELHEDLHRTDMTSCNDEEVHSIVQEKEEDYKRIIASMKETIKQQCSLVVEKAYQWKKSREERDGKAPTQNLPQHWAWNPEEEKWKNTCTGLVVHGNEDENPGFLLTSWNDMTPRDWITVIDSIMLMSYNRHFCENFGAEIAELKWLDRTGKFIDFHYAASKQTLRRRTIEASNSDDELDRMLNGDMVEESNCEQLTNVMRISVPGSPSDTKHWGHMIWLFSAFMENQEMKRSQAQEEI